MPAEALRADLGLFRVATLAQSFHWMERETVAATVRAMLRPGGNWVHVNATTHQGVDETDDIPLPSPPRGAIADLIRAYLGPVRRAGAPTLGGATTVG